MAQDGKKVAVGIGLAALAGGGIFLATRKRKEGDQAKIKIEILDSQGNPVPRKSPVSLIEGESYTVVVTVTNQSTRAGEPWAADLSVSVIAVVDGNVLLDGWTPGAHFTAGETKTLSYPFTVPVGVGTLSGVIDGRVVDPNGLVLATAQLPLETISAEIIYGAIITIT